MDAKCLKKVAMANLLLEKHIEICDATMEDGGAATTEHPKDLGVTPFPSLWATEKMKSWQKKWRMKLISFPQCMLGAIAGKKDTSIMGAEDLSWRSW